jgi:hypothetical protein
MSTEFVFRFKRGTPERWTTTNYILGPGEPGVEVVPDGPDLLKIGDGVTPWNSLTYVGLSPDDLTQEQLEAYVQQAVADLELTPTDASITNLLEDSGSTAHGAVVVIVHDETDPLVVLNTLFENALI